MPFPDGGFFVMRNDTDHVFIDCGPVGLGGRGGHGHNDCLSFEAVLDGTRLFTDCGAYVYTASATERNLFRSNAYHNTPSIDGEEMNRFFAWNVLWTLRYEAIPELRKWHSGTKQDEFEGAHGGYRKLAGEVVPVRTIHLDHFAHSLRILDRCEGEGDHRVEIPLHLDPGVTPELVCPGLVRLHSDTKKFDLEWSAPSCWELTIASARVSSSYGIAIPTSKLLWRREGPLRPLEVLIARAAIQSAESPLATYVRPHWRVDES